MINRIDPSGMIDETPEPWNPCQRDYSIQPSNCVTVSTLSQEKVRSDRIDTTLLGPWGVVLTVACGSPDEVTWNDPNYPQAKLHLRNAFDIVDKRLRAVTQGENNFASVFGGLELEYVDDVEDGAAALSPILKEGYLMKWSDIGRKGNLRANVPNEVTEDNIIHELGHILDYRSGHQNSQAADYSLDKVRGNFNLSTPFTYGGLRKQRIKEDDAERLADHFLNWVRLSYSPDVKTRLEEAKLDPNEKSYNNRVITTYWVGGYLAERNTTSPGMNYWARIASFKAMEGYAAFQHLSG